LIEKVQGVSPIFGCMTTKNINELYACHVKIEGRHSQFDGPTYSLGLFTSTSILADPWSNHTSLSLSLATYNALQLNIPSSSPWQQLQLLILIT